MKRRDFLKISALGLLSTGILKINPDLALSLSFRKKEEFEPPLSHIPIEGIIRPPGALPEREFRAKCISCGVCVNVCHTMKYDALAVVGLRDLKNFGTPYVKDMRDFPCGLCMECPKHCPTGALQPLPKERVAMGQALIDFSLCFGWNGDVCLSCSKACPLGAFVFDFYNSEWGNQPYINEKCVGCGLCVKYCPLGGSAVKVIKKETYKRIREEYDAQFQRLLNLSMEERYLVVYNENLPKIMARGRILEREYR
uniref:4Fe-4S dicluster domain-containing protein n=1 Tax=Caldimicrobium thiodismutans TaxID=1653476 RepID=A0A832GN60_9BACT